MEHFRILIKWIRSSFIALYLYTALARASLVSALDSSELGSVDWARGKNLLFWFVVHITHWGMYLGNIVAIGVIVSYSEWYYALPLVTILSNPLFGGIHCAYNNLENRYRHNLGWPLIESNFLPTILAEVKQLIKRK